MGPYSDIANSVVEEFYKPQYPSEEQVIEYLNAVEVSPFDDEKIQRYRGVRDDMVSRINSRQQEEHSEG